MHLLPEQIAKALVTESFHSRKFFVGIFVLVNAAALVAGFFWNRMYTASTSILVDERTIIQPLMQGAAVATDAMDRSRNAREVIFGRKNMDIVLDYGGWQKTKPSNEEREVLVEEIKKRTLIAMVGKNILRIEYRDDDPVRAFRVTEKMGDLFIQESIAAKAAESSAAFEFIDKQTQDYQEKLSRTEGELKELRSENLETGPGAEGEVANRVNELNRRIDAATQELKETEVKATLLDRQVSGEAESTADTYRDTQFRGRIGELQTKLDTLLLSYRETHPDVIQVKQQIQDLNDQLNAQHDRPVRSKWQDGAAVNNPVYQQLRKEQTQTQGLIEALKARINELRRQLQEESGRGRRLHLGDARLAELTRDYQVNRDIYQDLLRRRENARVSMNLDRDRQGPSYKIQEPATLPQAPTGPRFLHFIVGGMVLGVLIPLALFYVRIQVDPRVRVGTQIASTYKVPIVAIVPHKWSPAELKALRFELAFLTLLVVATVGTVGVLSAMRFIKVL